MDYKNLVAQLSIDIAVEDKKDNEYLENYRYHAAQAKYYTSAKADAQYQSDSVKKDDPHYPKDAVDLHSTMLDINIEAHESLKRAWMLRYSFDHSKNIAPSHRRNRKA